MFMEADGRVLMGQRTDMYCTCFHLSSTTTTNSTSFPLIEQPSLDRDSYSSTKTL